MNTSQKIDMLMDLADNILRDESKKLSFIVAYSTRLLKNRDDPLSSDMKKYVLHMDSLKLQFARHTSLLNAQMDNVGYESQEFSDSEASDFENEASDSEASEDLAFPSIDFSFMDETEELNPVFKFDPRLNILIVKTVEEYSSAIRNKMKIGADYQIQPSSHCNFTLKGMVCPNAYRCGMIHIKRCKYGNNCRNKGCCFLHLRDMPNLKAKWYFESSAEQYNKVVFF